MAILIYAAIALLCAYSTTVNACSCPWTPTDKLKSSKYIIDGTIVGKQKKESRRVNEYQVRINKVYKGYPKSKVNSIVTISSRVGRFPGETSAMCGVDVLMPAVVNKNTFLVYSEFNGYNEITSCDLWIDWASHYNPSTIMLPGDNGCKSSIINYIKNGNKCIQ